MFLKCITKYIYSIWKIWFRAEQKHIEFNKEKMFYPRDVTALSLIPGNFGYVYAVNANTESVLKVLRILRMCMHFDEYCLPHLTKTSRSM
jgi:hypothetical protein